MDAQARAARYGSISPEVFDGMDFEEAAELARRVTDMHIEDVKMIAELHTELTKWMMRALGAKI